MPKSTTKELSALRETVFSRDNYTCVWPGCSVGRERDWSLNQLRATLQLAHLTHRGMGGSKYANRPENCVTLCSVHHDVLDGRTALGTLRFELNEMLKHVVSVGDGGVTP